MNTALLSRAQEHLVHGRLNEAEADYLGLVLKFPGIAELHAALGTIAGQTGRHALALQRLEKACEIESGNPVYWHNLGEALRLLGRIPESERALRRAVQIEPGFAPAYASLIVLTQVVLGETLARNDEAAATAATAELALLCNQQGNALLATGDLCAAIASYRRALSFKAEYPIALSNLGNVLRDTGQVSEAEAMCRAALCMAPDFPEAWNNLGTALTLQGRLDEALACLDRALALNPDFPAARHNAGSGQFLSLLMDPDIDESEIAARHRRWAAAFPPPAAEAARPRARNSKSQRIRVGYLSTDFRQHAMLHYLEPILARHDPDRVEVICYAQVPGADEHTLRLMDYGHRWVWIHGLDDDQLAARLRSDALDILVDCVGHTLGTRLAALAGKPAPIMISWLGYLGTTGLPAMDYRLTDAWVDPPGLTEAQHTEKLIRLAGGMMAYRPHASFPPVSELPASKSGCITFGSLNNLQKINTAVVKTWAGILKATPRSRLLLQTKMLVDAGMLNRIHGMFEAFGVHRRQLDLRPASANFMQTYDAIDIALDTFPYGGGATTCDALWMGVPVITLSGKRPAGRLSTSILQQIERAGWIAGTPREYLEKACGMAADIDSLGAERAALRQRMQASSLCDEANYVRRLEELYLSLVA